MILTKKELSYPKISIVTILPHDLNFKFARLKKNSHSVTWMSDSKLAPLFRFLSGQPNLQLPSCHDKQSQDIFLRDHWTPNFNYGAAISFMLANDASDDRHPPAFRQMLADFSADIGVTHQRINDSLTVHQYTISGDTTQKCPCGKLYTTAFHHSLAKLGIGLWKCISENNGSWYPKGYLPGGFLQQCTKSKMAKKLRGLLHISSKRKSDRHFNRADHGEFGFSGVTTTMYEIKGEVDWSGLDEMILANDKGGAKPVADDDELHSGLSDEALHRTTPLCSCPHIFFVFSKAVLNLVLGFLLSDCLESSTPIWCPE